MLRNTTSYAFIAFAFVFVLITFNTGFGRDSIKSYAFQQEPSTSPDGSSNHGFEKSKSKWTFQHSSPTSHVRTTEAIDGLIKEADTAFNNLLSRQSLSLEEAAQAYRERRGRHPPPGFRKWFEYARKHDAIVIEEFWDQIYHDLEPFWAIPPAQIRAQARDIGMIVFIKDGQAFTDTDWFWHMIWKNMIQEVAHMLPDMLIPLNPMDEPRLMASFEQVSAYIAKAHSERLMPNASEVNRGTTGWSGESEAPTDIPTVEWFGQAAPYSWARKACPSDSPIHSDMDVMFAKRGPVSDAQSVMTTDSSKMLIVNSTLSSDACSDPAIAVYHAALTSPLTLSVSHVLQPIFGGSKLSINNDILLPAPMYWNGEERFDQSDVTPWSEKSGTVVWRGTATGGRHNAFNWFHFQRHRFVALANGTKYTSSDGIYDKIFPTNQRQVAVDALPPRLRENLASYLETTNDVGFTDLFCDIPQEEGKCWYLDAQYKISGTMALAEQYKHKIVPDIDGNSFSGRYRSFLLSNSLPFKATLFREWHDSRLVAWKHFVPMNNRFTDYYSLLAYFLGCKEEICGPDGALEAHDGEAETIATAGSEWAKRVLRKEDMQIYVGRLLLEFGRVTDDNRAWTGWVDDLLPNFSDS